MCELFDESPVLRQHPGVMHPDTGSHQLRQGRAEARREPKAADLVGDAIPLFPGCHPRREQRLRALDGSSLREVHDVDGGEVLLEQRLDGLMHGGVHVAVVQRNRAVDARHMRHLATRAAFEVFRDVGQVAEGRRHQHEPGVVQHQKRNLPRPPPLRVGVKVELVGDHHIDGSGRSLAQREVRHDLGRRAHDGGIRVHARVTGYHADVLGSENVDEGEELLAHQRLQWSRVERPLTLRKGRGMRGNRDERLAGSGGSREHQMPVKREFENRLLLGRIEPQPASASPFVERLHERIRIPGRRKGGDQGSDHGSSLPCGLHADCTTRPHHSTADGMAELIPRAGDTLSG